MGHRHCMCTGRRRLGWACPSTSHRRSLPFPVCLVYESILKLQSEKNDTYQCPVANLMALSCPVRRVADLLGSHAVELVPEWLVGWIGRQ
jgi:hypothetical protein